MDVSCLFKSVIGFEFCSIVNALILIFAMLINIHVHALASYSKTGHFNLHLSFTKTFLSSASGTSVLVC